MVQWWDSSAHSLQGSSVGGVCQACFCRLRHAGIREISAVMGSTSLSRFAGWCSIGKTKVCIHCFIQHVTHAKHCRFSFGSTAAHSCWKLVGKEGCVLQMQRSLGRCSKVGSLTSAY